MNQLYYGDNLDVLRQHIDSESIDLVYLDPPFNSNASYNVLFAEQDGTKAASQIKAFEDTWQWDETAARACQEIIEAGGKVSEAMQAFRRFLGDSNMMAYLSMMAPRLVELRRVLKPTGSIYLHCDPTASHYLKMLMDGVFGPRRFLNEISWKRSSAHSDTKQGMKRCGRIRDVLLLYTKSDLYTWNAQYTSYTHEYVTSEYRHVEKASGRRYKQTDLTAAKPGGDTEYEWRVKRPGATGPWHADLDDEYLRPRSGWEYNGVLPYRGRYWAYSKANMAEFARKGHLHHRRTGIPRLIQYADEMPGIPLQDLWDDISPERGDEDLGYPTQKPRALLERIVEVSSNKGDTVLDPFCGCGTTVAAAQRVHRQWIGIDITSLAISLIRHRLADSFGSTAEYEVIGEPVSLPDARRLAHDDPYQFQWWALGLVGARPVEGKKGADKGIDGRIYFHEGDRAKTKQIILSVKAGHVTVAHLRDLRGVLDREKAEIGVLLCMDEPTVPMRKEAAGAGFYRSPWGRHPRLQILTIEDLLTGRVISRPPQQTSVTFKRAPKTQDDVRETRRMPFGEPEDPDWT
ncbi:MAG: DNA methyltransferase [Acidobacteriota bacterium]